MTKKAMQDLYPEKFSHCYGCGTLNDAGLKIKSYWEGQESVCSFTPRPEHTAFPGFVYGGLIASVIDCHSTGTAAAAAYRHEGREPGSDPPLRFVTGSLHVDFLKPTPLGPPLELRSRVKEIGARKIVVETDLSVNGVLCARGSVVAVKIPESMMG
jgi:acyl-coenzyme A thioesterase PaaI-like protein